MSERVPSQSDLFRPVLASLAESDSSMKVSRLYDKVAERVRVSQRVRKRLRTCKGHRSGYEVFSQSVRWVIQRAKAKGYVRSPRFGEWEVTGKGRKALTSPRPGLVVTVIVADDGIALWGCAADAMAAIDDGSVQLAITSPPYPLLREKAYGNEPASAYNDWLLRMLEGVLPKLCADGSLVLNIGEAWNPGEPTQSTFSERLLIALEDRLGLNLCQRMEWHNPAKLPAPAEWVTVRKNRIKPSLERVWWLSPTAWPKSRQENVLVPYSDSMKSRLASGGETRAHQRPSGHGLAVGAFGNDRGGSIPPALLTASNTESNSAYIQACKAAGLPVHPARFPAALPAFFVNLCTDPGDVVMDFFAGSGTVAQEARRLNRRWILVEKFLEYIRGAGLRLDEPMRISPP